MWEDWLAGLFDNVDTGGAVDTAGDLGDLGDLASFTDGGSLVDDLGPSGAAGGGGLMDWLGSLNLSPAVVSTLLGALGPAASLGGTLASGGQGPSTAGTTSQNEMGTTSGQRFGTTAGGRTGTSAGGRTGLTTGGRTGLTTGGRGVSTTGTTQGTRTGTTQGTRGYRSIEDAIRQGYADTTERFTLDPAAQQAMDRLSGMLGGNVGGAQSAYTSGLSMLEQLARGQMGAMTGTGGLEVPAAPTAPAAPGAPNTTPNVNPVTGFPTAMPTAYNAGLGNLIKQAMGSFVGDLGARAITNARNRGFAGGADLLGSAAAPMMGQALAEVPAMEAKAYLDHVLQAYGLESENAARRSAAESAAQNAATNALGPGIAKYSADVSRYGMDRNAELGRYNADVSRYGIDRSANNQQIAQITSLLQALMGPQERLMQGNLALLASAPRDRTSSTLSGDTTRRNLSGTEDTSSTTWEEMLGQTTGRTDENQWGQTDERTTGQTDENQWGQSSENNWGQTDERTAGQTTGARTGTQTGTSSFPLGPAIGQGLGNIFMGGAQGFAANDARQQQQAFNQRLMDLLARSG